MLLTPEPEVFDEVEELFEPESVLPCVSQHDVVVNVEELVDNPILGCSVCIEVVGHNIDHMTHQVRDLDPGRSVIATQQNQAQLLQFAVDLLFQKLIGFVFTDGEERF